MLIAIQTIALSIKHFKDDHSDSNLCSDPERSDVMKPLHKQSFQSHTIIISVLSIIQIITVNSDIQVVIKIE